jgi:Methylase involved in ubiquinone/menaquinone biosynthesis
MCPVCGAEKYVITGKPVVNKTAQSIIKEDYSVVQCSRCSLYFVAPQIDFTAEERKLLYNPDYFSVQTEWLVKKRENELIQRMEIFERFVKSDEINFLDIGCGEGNTLSAALAKGWKVNGIDITDNRIEKAKDKKINFTEGMFLETEYKPDSFDIIYIDSVLEHVVDPFGYLKEIRRILKKGGVIYVGVPNEDSLQNDIKKIVYNFTGKKHIAKQLKPFDTPYHIIGFNRKSLKEAVERAGLKIVKLHNFGRKFEFLGVPRGSKGFYIQLFLLPFEFLGMITGRDVYFEALLTKE